MPTAITLDRSRSYGTVHGENTGNAAYEQDGILFDFQGDLIEELLTPAQREKIARKQAVADAERAAREAYEAVLASTATPAAMPGVPENSITPALPPFEASPLNTTADMVDLRAWLMGTQKAQFFAVTKALKEQFGFAASDKQSAVKFLCDQFGLEPSAVRV